MVAEVFLSGFSEEQQPMPREESKHSSGNPKCQVLPRACISNRAGGTPEKQSPAARPGPHPAKADQCQHRCFNVHNIYKPDSSRQFIWNLFF